MSLLNYIYKYKLKKEWIVGNNYKKLIAIILITTLFKSQNAFHYIILVFSRN